MRVIRWMFLLTGWGFGADSEKDLTSSDPWGMGMCGFGECLPYEHNRISHSPDKTDKWGLLAWEACRGNPSSITKTRRCGSLTARAADSSVSKMNKGNI
jgi:hypothetical protein